MESAKQIIALLVQTSMFLMIMAIAMESHWRNVVKELTHPRLLVRAVIAVNIVVPLVAIALVKIMSLPLSVAVGLLLMAVSPLAPLVPSNALKAGGRRSYILALYLVLIVLAIAIVPLTMSIVDAIFGGHAFVPVATVAKIMFVSGILPIVIGLGLHALFPDGAGRAARWVTLLSNVVLGVFVLLIVFKLRGQFFEMIGDGTIIAFALTVVAGIVAGHLLGGGAARDGGTLAIAAAIRHPGIAFAIAHASGARPQALAAVILFLLVGVIVVTLYVAWLKRQLPDAAAGDSAVV